MLLRMKLIMFDKRKVDATSKGVNMAKAVNNLKIETVRFIRQDSFVIAIVSYENGMTGLGVAKCATKLGDTFNMREGKKLAVKRAKPVKKLYTSNFWSFWERL